MRCGACGQSWDDADYCAALPATSVWRQYFADVLAEKEFWSQFQ